jgi:hypothetical protein
METSAAKILTDSESTDPAETLASIRTAHELAREEELDRLKQELEELRAQFLVMAARRRR